MLFICLAFYVVLLETLAMEHLTRRGSRLKKFPFTHRIIAHFCRPQSVSSSMFYDGIVISRLPPNR
jgi:hypothetical protein